MKMLAQLFSRNPSAKDIRNHLGEIERDQLRRRRDLDLLAEAKQQKLSEAVAAKKAGNQELLREIFREMRQVEIEHGYANSDLRRISLSKTALTAFLRKIEMLEKKEDRRSAQNLIQRIKDSSIQRAIDSADIDDDAFSGMLGDILGEEELNAGRGKASEDPGFAEFDRAISEMAKAEGGELLAAGAESRSQRTKR